MKDFRHPLDGDLIALAEELGDHMPGGFFVYRAEEPGELLYANQATFSIYGCDDKDDFAKLTGFTFEGMVYPEDYALALAKIDADIAAGEDRMDHVEYRICRKDGELRWIDDYGHFAETSAYGNVYFVFISDITQQHEAQQEAYLRLEQRMQSAAELAGLMGSVASLLSNMPAMSFSKDAATGRYLACNQPFADYAHKSRPEDVVGLTDHEIFDPQTAQKFVEDDQTALTMDEPYVFFEDVPDAEGNLRNLQTTKLKFVDDTGRLCTLGMCVDVSEITRMKEQEAHQQELEERLALQEKLLEEQSRREQLDKMITAMASDYRSVYQINLDTDDGICHRADPHDADQTPAGVHFSYLERFTYYGQSYVTEPYREGFLAFIQPDSVRAGLANDPIIAYRYLVRRNGHEYYEMLRIAGVRLPADRDDGIVHSVGLGFTVIDAEMRETLARNQALIEALDAAEDASRAKTTFLSNMSHEIRTPMNAIIGLDSLALRDESLTGDLRTYLEKIGASARHLLSLINDILDMSRIESGRMMLRKEEFSFGGMLEQINTMVMSQCQDKGLDFECNVIGPMDEYYVGDDMKLKQILINILSNAIKFTDAPGRVTLSVERVARYEDQATLRFSIADTGIGMDESFIPKIFDSFTQEDSRRSDKFGSTGLGMAITKNLVEMMNGTIDVTSRKGVGTTFTVVITLTISGRNTLSSEHIDVSSLHVLIVDDDPVACEHARVVLTDAGILAETCNAAEEALEALDVAYAKHEPFNLVLTDWKMPDIDGLELSQLIHERYGDKTVVFLLSAYDWHEVHDEATKAGIEGFLGKLPFAANIVEEYQRVIRRRNAKQLREEHRADLAGRRVLLAEDVPINAEIVEEFLNFREVKVDHAVNGRIAVEMFETSAEGTYDAILMDVQMPEMGGLEATETIRALPRADASRIPIIAMTANAFDEDVQRSLQAGMNAHLSKPLDPDRLYATLEELIYEVDH